MLASSLSSGSIAEVGERKKDSVVTGKRRKNAWFSLDKSYAIFPQILWFSPIFPSPWYFFPVILSAVVFFRNTTAGGKIPCLKIEHD